MNALLWAVTALIILVTIYAIAHDDTAPRRPPPRHNGRGREVQPETQSPPPPPPPPPPAEKRADQ